MKYSFCYSVKKIVAENEVDSETEVHPLGSEDVVFRFGPWRDTRDEAKADEKLYYDDREAFLIMIDKEGCKE